jgi:hypothetical protein
LLLLLPALIRELNWHGQKPYDTTINSTLSTHACADSCIHDHAMASRLQGLGGQTAHSTCNSPQHMGSCKSSRSNGSMFLKCSAS